MGSRPPSQASSGSSRRTSLASLSESAEFAGERSEDDGERRSFQDRQLLRGFHKKTVNVDVYLHVIQAYRAGRR